MESRRQFASQNESLLRDLSRVATQLRLGSNHNGAILRAELLVLAQKLAQHHQMEAARLYPELAASKRSPVRLAARSTDRRFTDVSEQLERFLHRWPDADGIDTHHDEFVEDAARLVAKLRATLVREAAELFGAAGGG